MNSEPLRLIITVKNILRLTSGTYDVEIIESYYSGQTKPPLILELWSTYAIGSAW